MKKMNIIVLLLLILTGWLYSEELNNYSIIEVNVIPTGKKEGMIGWMPRMAGGHSGPTSFTINNKYIYIPDRVNYRINVYDLNLNFVKTIIEDKKESHFAFAIKVDENENLTSLLVGKGLKKINQSGETLFFIPWKDLSDSTQTYNYFVLKDEVFMYNNQGEVEYIDNSGKIEGTDKAIAKLLEISKDKEQLQIKFANEINISDKKMQIIETLRNSGEYILVDVDFYSTNFRKTREYFEKIKDIREYVKLEKAKVRSSVEKKEVNLSIEDFSIHFFDYDANHNSYWMGIIDKPNKTKKFAVIIYSKYGELLDAFYYGQYKKGETPGWQHDFSQYPTSGAEVAIAPTGDVYFLVGNKEKYTLYKVERQW